MNEGDKYAGMSKSVFNNEVIPHFKKMKKGQKIGRYYFVQFSYRWPRIEVSFSENCLNPFWVHYTKLIN